MQYAIASVDPKLLGKLQIDQDFMIREFNQKFIPRQVYDLLKRRSKDFTEEDPLLNEAADLLNQLLVQKSQPDSAGKSTPPINAAVMIEIKRKARSRKMEILKLKRQRAKQ